MLELTKLPGPSLPELQAWFLTVMTAPGGLAHGLALAQERYGFGEADLLRPSSGERSRLGIYADGYIMRLLDCLQADYPVLRKVMGEPLFDFFAKAYIWRHPSRSPTLYDLGAGFADFLADSQPAGLDAAAALQFRFPVELGRLERARSEAGRAPGLEKSPLPAASGGFDWFDSVDTTLQLVPCTRLLEVSFPLQAFWEQAAHLADGMDLPPPPPPSAAPGFVAIARLHYRLSMFNLQPWQFHYLQASRAGAPSRHCALQAATASGLPTGQVLADALLWQPLAIAAGLLTIATGDRPRLQSNIAS